MRPGARLLLSAVALAAGLAVPWIAGRAPQIVEQVYSRGVFPFLARGLGWIGRAAPFSFAQIAAALAIAGLAVWLIRMIGMLRQRQRGEPLAWAARTLTALAVLVWSFQLLWGFHYSRPTLLDRLGYPPVEPDAARLSRLVRSLVQETNLAHAAAIRSGEIVPAPDAKATPDASNDASDANRDTKPGANQDANGTPPIAYASSVTAPVPEILSMLEAGYRLLDPATAEIRFAAPKRPEPASALLTRFGISGLYFPFTGEANVNGRIPLVSLPFTSAHEMAHQRGIAREDEANLMAFLACRASGSTVARYSGALSALARARRALWTTAPDSLDSSGGALGPGPRADLETIRRFWARHEGPASRVAERVNDSYLKANAQTAGIASYDRMIEILVALQEAGALDDRIPEVSRP